MPEDKTNFAEKIFLKSFGGIFLYRAFSMENEPVFFYVLIRGDKLKAFKDKIDKKQPFDIAHYGKILISGYGEPDEAVRGYMEKEFGFQHDKAIEININN